jgi:hypothetical protein
VPFGSTMLSNWINGIESGTKRSILHSTTSHTINLQPNSILKTILKSLEIRYKNFVMIPTLLRSQTMLNLRRQIVTTRMTICQIANQCWSHLLVATTITSTTATTATLKSTIFVTFVNTFFELHLELQGPQKRVIFHMFSTG